MKKKSRRDVDVVEKNVPPGAPGTTFKRKDREGIKREKREMTKRTKCRIYKNRVYGRRKLERK